MLRSVETNLRSLGVEDKNHKGSMPLHFAATRRRPRSHEVIVAASYGYIDIFFLLIFEKVGEKIRLIHKATQLSNL